VESKAAVLVPVHCSSQWTQLEPGRHCYMVYKVVCVFLLTPCNPLLLNLAQVRTGHKPRFINKDGWFAVSGTGEFQQDDFMEALSFPFYEGIHGD
jgi:hypothetical protein